MKISAPIYLLIMFGLFFVSCEDDEGNLPLNNTTPETSADITSGYAASGDWEITYFNDSGTDETADFAGYAFTFNTDGTLVATNGTETINGTWSILDDSSNSSSDDDGNSTDDDDFNIMFVVSETHNFDDLIDDWDFVSVSETKIELLDVSGGDGTTDYLTFERI